MNKHTATCPRGEIFTRNSMNRTYTHVILTQSKHRPDGSWSAFSWCGRLDLAHKALAQTRRFSSITNAMIAEVTMTQTKKRGAQ